MLKYTYILSYVCSFAAHTWLPGRNCYEIGTTIRAHIAPHIKWQVEWINFITFALRAPQSKTTQGKSYQINLNQLNSAFIQTLGETSRHDVTTARTVVRRGKARWLRQVEGAYKPPPNECQRTWAALSRYWVIAHANLTTHSNSKRQ